MPTWKERYICFVMEMYYPCGGSGDEKFRFNTYAEYEEKIGLDRYGEVEILDLLTGKWIDGTDYEKSNCVDNTQNNLS